MNKKQPTLGDIYGQMLKKVDVVEEKCDLCADEQINKSKKHPKQPKSAFSEKNPLTKGGPQEKGGFHKALNDENDYEEEEEYEFDDNSKKIARKRLNTFMTKKSTFDKLFESVMGGAFDNQEEQEVVDALGLKDAPTDEEFGDEDMGDEDMGGEVTFTLDRETAQKLHDVLMSVLGGEEMESDELDFDSEENMEDEEYDDENEGEDESEDEDEEFDNQEDEEEETIGSKGGSEKNKLQQHDNKVKGKPQPKSQGTKVVGTTDKVGNDGDHGHALYNAKQPDMGKQNKVSDLRQAEDYFR